MKTLTAFILLFYIGLQETEACNQLIARSGIRLTRITYLTSNLDSLTRSFLKKGYHIKTGKREPGGIFNNSIILQDGSEIILETTSSRDSNDWRLQALKKYGNHIAGIAFEVDQIDSLYHSMKFHNISLGDRDTIRQYRIDGTYYSTLGFALDSCAPLDVVFFSRDTNSIQHSPEFDSLAHHPNHVFRFDWVLLSASPSGESRLRILFEIINAWKQHEGCCDFWRVGPSNDFCFFRFDPPPPKAKGKADWLSIEPDGIYFAY